MVLEKKRITVCIAILCVALTARADRTSQVVTDTPRQSIHAVETSIHAQDPVFEPPAAKAITPLWPRPASPFKQVHGFHPYWMGTSYTSYDWALLSTVSFFALELDAAGNIVNAHGWPWTGLVSTAHAQGVRVTVTVQLFTSAALSTLLASAANRQNAITQVVSAVTSGNADGVCVDFEGVPGTRKSDLVTFLGDLRTALQAAVANAYLAIATPAVDWDNAFDYDQLAARCDHLVVMTYDYHWANSPTTGPVSPLAGWGTYNVAWTIQDYVFWGTPREKMLLGVPYYGYRWPSTSGAAGAPTTGSGTALTYTQAATEAAAHGTIWDAASSTPWLRYQNPGWLQTWYDDDQSLDAKYTRVWTESLGGVSIWALGYDGTRPELWSSLRTAFGTRVADTAPADALDAIAITPAGPNPFHDVTSVRLTAPTTIHAELDVFASNGRIVRTLWSGTVTPSGSTVGWNGCDSHGRAVGAGVYWLRLRAGSNSSAQRVIRLSP